MKNKKSPISYLSAPVVSLAALFLLVAGSIFVHKNVFHFHWSFEPLHSAIEITGAVIAIFLALLILLLSRHNKGYAEYVWVSSALMGMGVLGGFHAFMPPGASFVLLRVTADFIGGILFAMIWIPERAIYPWIRKMLPKLVFVFSCLLGIGLVVFQNKLPLTMYSDNLFSSFPEILHYFSGILFLIAAVRFAMRYLKNKNLSDFLFGNFCALFGLSGILFQYSQMFGINWWYWHIAGLIVYIMALRYIFTLYRRAITENYSLVFHNSIDGFWIVDGVGRILDANEAYCNMSGYSREELLTMSIRDLEVQEAPEEVEKHTQRIAKHGSDRFETRHRRKNGATFNVEISVSYVLVEDTGRFFAFLRDITERKVIEQKAREAYQVQSAISELLKVSLENISLEETLKKIITRIISMPWLTLEPKSAIFLADEKSGKLVMAAQEGLAKELLTLCATVPFGWCLCGRAAASNEIVFSDCLDEKHEIRFDGMKSHGHYCVPIASGEKKLLGVLNLYVEAGHRSTQREKDFLTAIANVVAGIVERKKQEDELQKAYVKLKDTQTQLIQAEKLEAVGRMASGVAHEVKNPLATAILGVNFLEEKLPESQGEVFEVLKIVKAGINRADKIVRALLDFSKPSGLHLEPENINTMIEDSLILVQHAVNLGNVTIVRELGKDLPKIQVEEGKIVQAFMNIFLNAIQAMPDGGKLFIRTYLTMVNEFGNRAGRRGNDYFKPGEKVAAVEIEDTGCGISEEYLEKIFDPFFTTKSDGGGTGLGLSVTHSIIDMHKGSITAQSEIGKGTKFIIFLKIAGG